MRAEIRNRTPLIALHAVSVLLFPQLLSAAVNEPLDLAESVNADLTVYTRAATYPQHGGLIQVNGIPFQLAAGGPENHTAIVQSFSDKALSREGVEFAPRGERQKKTYVNVIPVHRKNVISVYVMMNSAYGMCGHVVGDLTFRSAEGKAYVYRLKEGLNIRDHNDGTYCNDLSEFAGVANFGNVRLDFQRVDLPANFGSALDEIILHGYQSRHGGTGAPFIAGITLLVNEESVTSTVRYSGEVDGGSAGEHLLSCVNTPHAPSCTPVNSSVTRTGAATYHVVLPADLAFGAAIPNPAHAPIKISNQNGSVCLARNEGCVSSNVAGSPAGEGYLDPGRPRGALIEREAGGYTAFSINGRLADEVAIPRSNGKRFQGYEGFYMFDVTISTQR